MTITSNESMSWCGARILGRCLLDPGPPGVVYSKIVKWGGGCGELSSCSLSFRRHRLRRLHQPKSRNHQAPSVFRIDRGDKPGRVTTSAGLYPPASPRWDSGDTRIDVDLLTGNNLRNVLNQDALLRNRIFVLQGSRRARKLRQGNREHALLSAVLRKSNAFSSRRGARALPTKLRSRGEAVPAYAHSSGIQVSQMTASKGMPDTTPSGKRCVCFHLTCSRGKKPSVALAKKAAARRASRKAQSLRKVRTLMTLTSASNSSRAGSKVNAAVVHDPAAKDLDRVKPDHEGSHHAAIISSGDVPAVRRRPPTQVSKTLLCSRKKLWPSQECEVEAHSLKPSRLTSMVADGSGEGTQEALHPGIAVPTKELQAHEQRSVHTPDTRKDGDQL